MRLAAYSGIPDPPRSRLSCLLDRNDLPSHRWNLVPSRGLFRTSWNVLSFAPALGTYSDYFRCYGSYQTSSSYCQNAAPDSSYHCHTFASPIRYSYRYCRHDRRTYRRSKSFPREYYYLVAGRWFKATDLKGIPESAINQFKSTLSTQIAASRPSFREVVSCGKQGPIMMDVEVAVGDLGMPNSAQSA